MNSIRLSTEDFHVSDADAEASVRINDKPIDLILLDCVDVGSTQVKACIAALELWKSECENFTKRTEAFVQRFLPGKKVAQDELDLFQVELTWEDDKPCGVLYRFRVAGEYDKPQYNLSQFDSRSVVEADLPINKGEFVLSEMSLASNNDFD